MNFDKKVFNKFFKRKKVIITLILIGIVSVLGFCIFSGVISTPWTNSLSCFDGPSYIPEGYLSVDNNTTSIDKNYYLYLA